MDTHSITLHTAVCISRCTYVRTYVQSVATVCISTICAHIYNLCSLLPLHLLFTPSCTHTNTHMYTCTYTHYTHKHSPTYIYTTCTNTNPHTYIHTTCTNTNPHPHTRIHVLYIRMHVHMCRQEVLQQGAMVWCAVQCPLPAGQHCSTHPGSPSHGGTPDCTDTGQQQ